MGSRGFLWVRIMGSKNVMGSGYGSNISDMFNISCQYPIGLAVLFFFLSYFLLERRPSSPIFTRNQMTWLTQLRLLCAKEWSSGWGRLTPVTWTWQQERTSIITRTQTLQLLGCWPGTWGSLMGRSGTRSEVPGSCTRPSCPWTQTTAWSRLLFPGAVILLKLSTQQKQFW